jgi:hypothetical protein
MILNRLFCKTKPIIQMEEMCTPMFIKALSSQSQDVEPTEVCVDGWMDRRMGEWVDGWMGRWMDG